MYFQADMSIRLNVKFFEASSLHRSGLKQNGRRDLIATHQNSHSQFRSSTKFSSKKLKLIYLNGRFVNICGGKWCFKRVSSQNVIIFIERGIEMTKEGVVYTERTPSIITRSIFTSRRLVLTNENTIYSAGIGFAIFIKVICLKRRKEIENK